MIRLRRGPSATAGAVRAQPSSPPLRVRTENVARTPAAAPVGTRGEESAACAQYSFFTAVFRVFFHAITGGSPQ